MVLAVLVLALLYLVTLVYAAGETMLAGAFLVTVALALWTYTSAKTIALRYLFPGVAAAVIFVVLPMVYTVSIGFTNYSSTNLADVERSRRFLLDEVAPGSGPAYGFTLHPDGSSFRIRLENQDPFVYTPGFEFNAWLSGGYSAQVSAWIYPDITDRAAVDAALAAPFLELALDSLRAQEDYEGLAELGKFLASDLAAVRAPHVRARRDLSDRSCT